MGCLIKMTVYCARASRRPQPWVPRRNCSAQERAVGFGRSPAVISLALTAWRSNSLARTVGFSRAARLTASSSESRVMRSWASAPTAMPHSAIPRPSATTLVTGRLRCSRSHPSWTAQRDAPGPPVDDDVGVERIAPVAGLVANLQVVAVRARMRERAGNSPPRRMSPRGETRTPRGASNPTRLRHRRDPASASRSGAGGHFLSPRVEVKSQHGRAAFDGAPGNELETGDGRAVRRRLLQPRAWRARRQGRAQSDHDRRSRSTHRQGPHTM